MAKLSEFGVVLPEGQTGSSFFYNVLAETAQAYPEVFATAALPSTANAFKASYGNALARFELARLASPMRVEIAQTIVNRTQNALGFASSTGRQMLCELLAQESDSADLTEIAYPGKPGLPLEIPFEGRVYRGDEIIGLAELLHERNHVTNAVVTAVRWLVDFSRASDGLINLSGQRFALMGAGAELAPTTMLLRAGATVLWIDVADPARCLASAEGLAGVLVQSVGATDLLKNPQGVAAAIRRFATSGPVHVGMFAYAAGASQEWRLASAMNAIVRSLPADVVASLAMLVSPTTVARAYAEAQDTMAQRKANLPRWQRLLQLAGALDAPGQLETGDVGVCRAVVSVQGVSYQAAQYVSKLLAAEVYANHGPRPHTQAAVTVSANVAGITRTRSLSHPVFQAAFAGAPAFDVQIFDSETTRALSGLLMLHDLLNPQAPGSKLHSYESPNAKAEALLSQQVHGGVYVLPFALESAIRVAALLGVGRKPSVLIGRKKTKAKPAAETRPS